jgi:two-component system, NarL family, response regulator NreC
MEHEINVGLIEDQKLFREGINAILSSEPGINVVFESPDGFSVIDRLHAAEIVPDILLIDLSLPPKGTEEFNGWRVLSELKTHFPAIKSIILSVHEDSYLIAKMIEDGAQGYLVKDSDPEEVFKAIKEVYQNGSYINKRTLDAIQSKLQGKVKIPQGFDELSSREVEVLKLICQQLTSEEIGERLFISPKTVNGHRNNLLQKTGSKNVTGLVMYAVKHKLVE